MDTRRSKVSRPDPRSEQGDPCGSPFFFGSRTRRRSAVASARAVAAAGLVAFAELAAAGTQADTGVADRAPLAATKASAVVLVAPDSARVQALDCADGRERASFPLPSAPAAGAMSASTSPAPSIALAVNGDAAFVGVGARLLRLPLPMLAPATQATLDFDATSLVAAGGADAIVLAGGVGTTPLSARDPDTLASLHEYRLENGQRASVSSLVDRPQRSRIVVAFSDLDEIWEIDYSRNAPPVLRGLVHDYRMREAVELPGRFTPRAFAVRGATRALVAGSQAHEMLRIDASGAIGVLNLNVRREIERPPVDAVPAAERIAAWQGQSARGWVFADEAAAALRVLDARSWKLAAPLSLPGAVLAVLALDDGGVLLAHDRGERIVLSRADVEARRLQEMAAAAQAGRPPYRFVRGAGGCIALVDAQNRWITGLIVGVRPGTRAAAPGRGS